MSSLTTGQRKAALQAGIDMIAAGHIPTVEELLEAVDAEDEGHRLVHAAKDAPKELRIIQRKLTNGRYYNGERHAAWAGPDGEGAKLAEREAELLTLLRAAAPYMRGASATAWAAMGTGLATQPEKESAAN